VSSVVEAPPRVLEGDSPLARCTGNADGFLRTTWGRSAAILHRADRLGYADLLSFDDVDRILSTTSLRTPSFRLVRSDRTIAESEYTRSGHTGSKPVDGMADPARVFELFRQGATIVLQGLHRYWPPVTEFCRGLELELGHPSQVNAYVTPPGAQGLALHDDPHDVFVLQAFGRKHWDVHAAPLEAERLPVEATLEPGDGIYMPEGTPHAASTQETLSGHLTIGVHVASWRDVLADAWNRLKADPSLDERVPAGWTGDPAGFARELAHRLAQTGTRLGELDAEELTQARIERFLSTRASLLRGTLVEQLALEAVDDDTRVHRRPGSVCELRTNGERLVVLLGDRRLEMPAWLEPAMRRIADRGPLRVGDLREEIADPQSRAVLIKRLAREGVLGLEPAR
jgi:bifunctional lysine-specific demethylase and histidyl-hydroxylase NO66